MVSGMTYLARFVALSITIAVVMLVPTRLQAAVLQSIAVTPANPSIAKGTTDSSPRREHLATTARRT
jgi:hypothetical protein